MEFAETAPVLGADDSYQFTRGVFFMAEILSLAAGSLLGGFGRYFLGGAVQRLAGGSFPYGTLLVNLLGCFIIGLLHSLTLSKLSLSANARLLLIVGFCGAFTTFSTFILETSAAMDQGRHFSALSYLAASVLLGFACFRAGLGLGRAWTPAKETSPTAQGIAPRAHIAIISVHSKEGKHAI